MALKVDGLPPLPGTTNAIPSGRNETLLPQVRKTSSDFEHEFAETAKLAADFSLYYKRAISLFAAKIFTRSVA
jgi:hypothetical protein